MRASSCIIFFHKRIRNFLWSLRLSYLPTFGRLFVRRLRDALVVAAADRSECVSDVHGGGNCYYNNVARGRVVVDKEIFCTYE